jgi:hypothetical protein
MVFMVWFSVVASPVFRRCFASPTLSPSSAKKVSARVPYAGTRPPPIRAGAKDDQAPREKIAKKLKNAANLV